MSAVLARIMGAVDGSDAVVFERRSARYSLEPQNAT